jgi:hypothetical protein
MINIRENLLKLTYASYLLGSKIPRFLKTSATMGTVELTGLEITRMNALGAVAAIPTARS